MKNLKRFNILHIALVCAFMAGGTSVATSPNSPGLFKPRLAFRNAKESDKLIKFKERLLLGYNNKNKDDLLLITIPELSAELRAALSSPEFKDGTKTVERIGGTWFYEDRIDHAIKNALKNHGVAVDDDDKIYFAEMTSSAGEVWCVHFLEKNTKVLVLPVYNEIFSEEEAIRTIANCTSPDGNIPPREERERVKSVLAHEKNGSSNTIERTEGGTSPPVAEPPTPGP